MAGKSHTFFLPMTPIPTHRTRPTAPSDGSTATIDNPLLPGWVRVRWDATGGVNSYEAGAHGLYSLSLASVLPSQPQGLRAELDDAVGVRLYWRPPTDEGTPGT